MSAGAAIGTGAADLPWVDLDGDGGVVDAGVAGTDGQPVAAREHPALAALFAFVEREDVQAGQVAAHGPDGIFWFTPAPIGAPHTLRGLAIGAAAFNRLIDRFAADRGVTAAEKRVLFQLVAGATPRAAAVADGVSVETKRVQIKSLCVKLGCSGQVDLVRRTMGQLVHLLQATAHDRPNTGQENRCVPKRSRCHPDG